MLLRELLYHVQVLAGHQFLDVAVTDVHIDSRKVGTGSCYIAVKGTITDGHLFIEDAIANGATAIVCEKMPPACKPNVSYVQVQDTSTAAGQIAHLFYGEPSTKCKLVGVTGTNGKTTVATLLYQLFTELGYSCGLVSTVQNIAGTTIINATHTTPNAVELNKLLALMVDKENCDYIFMECSSHAIHQHRLAGLNFAGAVFTNITHDHLDYHGNFDEYIRVKKSWFDSLPAASFAISNADDKRGKVMLQNTAARKFYYSLRTLADFKGKILTNSLEGLHMIVNDVEVYFTLIGTFNASNILAVYAAAICLEQDKAAVLTALSKLKGAQGRFEYMVSQHAKIVGIIDYAHTPDALLNVLATVYNIRLNTDAKLTTVVGCGGNRDAQKRPLMAEVACQHSDRVIFTADNPRNENAEDIIKEMEAGVPVIARKKYISIPDRREAIKTAVSLSQKQDIILVAGKGHEKYQEVHGVRKAFDDKQVLQEMFELLEK